LNAIALVGGLLAFPEHLRNDAEHGAAIEAERAVAEDPHIETTNAHEASVWAAVEIRDLRASDGEELRRLWTTSGIRIRPGDDDSTLGAFAARNPGLCLVGSEDDGIVASALAGWDGRRGWLYHVATHPDLRRRGIATRLVRELEKRLKALGCKKLNLIVWDHEQDAMAFWVALGYRRERTVEFGKELPAE
jgi:ribosomal protein S18 acetylase RimI-like enzyme